jgi:hypothetical protein
MDMEKLYEERLTFLRTAALFVVLTLLFLALVIWRAMVSGWAGLTIVFLFFLLFFLFYSINYRSLTITITPKVLSLKFGLFTWFIPLDNIEMIYRDKVSLYRIGGAGIHFTSIAGRYRAMFNFLEYPRLVLGLKQKRGPVKDIVFSTRYPDEIEQIIMQTLHKREE